MADTETLAPTSVIAPNKGDGFDIGGLAFVGVGIMVVVLFLAVRKLAADVNLLMADRGQAIPVTDSPNGEVNEHGTRGSHRVGRTGARDHVGRTAEDANE